MAILRNSTKLATSQNGIFDLKSQEVAETEQKEPTSHSGCMEVDFEGKPIYNPDQQPVPNIDEATEEKIDHRPKDWYDKQCSIETYLKGLTLNTVPLNKTGEEDDQN